MTTLAVSQTNHTTAISNCTNHASRSWVQVHFWYSFVVKIYHVISVFLCGVSFISFVEPQFLLYVSRKLQHFIVTDVIIYVCMPGVFHLTEKDNAAWLCDSVIVVFISLWKLKFLAYLLNVTRFVMRFIRKCCVFCSWQCPSHIEIVTPLGVRRGTGKEEENSSDFQGIQRVMFIKLWNRYRL